MSTTGTYNNCRNNKRDRDRGGGGGSSTDNKQAAGPKYLLTFKPADGGAKRIDWNTIPLNNKWNKRHITAWHRSKMYDTDNARWQVKDKEFKKFLAERKAGQSGRTNAAQTSAAKRAAFQAQLDALVLD